MYSQYPEPPYGPPPVPARQDGGATAAMVLGICSLVLCGLLGPVALFIGISARRRIRESGGYLSGDGQATAGIVMGAITSALIALAIVLIVVIVIASAGQH
jgi:Domain of unknown function (DUF4190)